MTKTIISLKGDRLSNSMLAPQENEVEIITLPLKKKQTMEITNIKLSVHDSKKIKLSVLMINVRSITPIKKDRIRIQFYEPKEVVYREFTKTVFKRKYVDYSLEKNDFSANHICRKIQKEFERSSVKTINQYGFLMMQDWESVVSVYQNIRTNKGTGMLYVTNAGLALETDEGIVFDVSYEHILLVTNHKKKVRILWKEPWNSLNNFKFDFEMNKKLDSNVVRVQIQNAFSLYRKKIGHEFIQLDQKYHNMSYDETFNLINIKNPEFQKYLELHVKHTFGYSAPQFEINDLENIICCKLAGLDLDVIKDISEEEATQRKESLDFYTQLSKYNEKYKEFYDVQLEMESQCDCKEDFVILQKSEKYINIIKALDNLKDNPDIPTLDNITDFEDKKLIHGANALKAYDVRTRILYEKWILDVPLIDCTDEYDDSWMKHLLEQLNCEHGGVETFGGSITTDKLKNGMKIRDRNGVTLASFIAPENIPIEDIYNNCWHDKKNKIWYVFDDNLDERLQNQAISDPDHSQGMCGRRVWGFGEDQVIMFAGFPSIVVQGHAVTEDTLFTVTCSREIGNNIEYLETKMRNFILPILREKDISEELMNKFGTFVIQTEAMLYSIGADGGCGWITPQMYSFWAKKHNLADIPIAERVRRAIFASKTGGWFSAQAQAPLESN